MGHNILREAEEDTPGGMQRHKPDEKREKHAYWGLNKEHKGWGIQIRGWMENILDYTERTEGNVHSKWLVGAEGVMHRRHIEGWRIQ